MSRGAVVHATIEERELRAERRAADAKQRVEQRRAWAARHLADLPVEFVAASIGILRSGGVEPTAERVRARTEARLRRFLTGSELAAMKANGGELPAPTPLERTAA